MRLASIALIAALAACSPQPAPEASAPLTAADEQASAAAPDLAIVNAPQAGARITSPLRVTGIAPANWYFENQFPVRVLDAQGAVIAEGPAHPDVNWTANAEPKAFAAELPFSVARETAAIVVLQEDMPGEGEAPREVRIAVVLVPS